jgi:hypothetical protein
VDEIRCCLVSEFGWTFRHIDGLDIRDVFALMKYWITWPPRHKLEAARAGYKAPMRRRPFKRGSDYRTDTEHMVQAAHGVIPFQRLPAYVQEVLVTHGNDPSNRNTS